MSRTPEPARSVHTVVVGAGHAGLTFIGLSWQHSQGSANLLDFASDAEYLAARWTV